MRSLRDVRNDLRKRKGERSPKEREREKDRGLAREKEEQRRDGGGVAGEGSRGAGSKVLSTQDRHPATCQQTLPTREEHVREKSPGKHEDGESAAR